MRKIALFLLAIALWGADPSLEFVHLSDAHVGNFRAVHPDFAGALMVKMLANANLDTALHNLAAGSQPDFVVITGDLIDGYSYAGPKHETVRGQIDVFTQALAGTALTVFPVLGNHDLTHYRRDPAKPGPITDQSVAAAAREAWIHAVPNFQEGTYYSFRRQVGAAGYLFLALDDGEAKGLNAEYAATQLAWVRRQLASHPTDAVILAMHIPMPMVPFADGLRAILAESRNVVAILAGHRHSNAIEQVEAGGRSIPQIRTAALFMSAGNIRRIRLYQDRIEVTATGNPKELELTVPVARAAAASAGR